MERLSSQAIWAVVVFSCNLAFAQEDTKNFLSEHCAACHNGDEQVGRLDVESLRYEPSDPDNFARWINIHDRVKRGEMPPPDEAEVAQDEVELFVNRLAATLADSESEKYSNRGRAEVRRLNRYEYENTLRDILNIPWAQIKEKLPEDGVAFRFNKTGQALDVSHVQLARYMSTAEYAIQEAIRVVWDRRESTVRRYYARDEASLNRSFRPRENSTLPDRHSFPVLDSKAQPEVRSGREPVTSPETREREAVGKVSSIFSDAGGYSWNQFRAPVAGTYKLRFKGYTIWVSGGGISRWYFEGFEDEKTPVYYLPLWHRPNVDEIWAGRTNEPMSVFAQSSGQNRLIGEFDFTPEPTECEVTVMLRAGEVVRTDGSRLFRTRVNGTGEQYINPLATKHGMPGYAIQWMEVEGPLHDTGFDEGYRLLFGELPLVLAEEGEQGIKLQPIPHGRIGFRRENAEPVRPAVVRVESVDPEKDAERLIRAFIKRVYRRPVADYEIELFLDLFQQQREVGHGFTQSLVSTYQAVLSSPGFLYTAEQPGKLNPFALAVRLSMFLWNSEPDTRLRELAVSGRINNPQVLHEETERLLNDPRSERFVTAFTDYWLDLREIDDNSPSTTLYNDYELDDPLKLASLAETRLFLAELLKQDLPARNIVDSDFTFLNERLAGHYGIEGVTGTAMRRVTLEHNSVRGGLMTQASVLKVTANGTTTSPVLRGAWVTERILGFETPPPPPVPAVEPDIRGAVTIRQQIEAHRADRSCAVCHDRMDPPGLALESFDVMGAWRGRYRAVNESAQPEQGVGLDGQVFRFHFALPVDPSGQLIDGRAFNDVRELKALLLEDQEQLARNLVRQLTVYATGAPIGFSDRLVIEEILDKARASEFGVRSLVHYVVQSDLFQCQ